MNINQTKNIKEEKRMAMAMKPTQATIIKKNMLPLFLAELNANKVTKEYWDECRASKTAFTPDDIAKMKKMCNGK